MFLALVMTWNQLAACERTVAALDRLQHVQQAKAVVTQPNERRALVAHQKGVKARDVASMCVAAVVGD